MSPHLTTHAPAHAPELRAVSAADEDTTVDLPLANATEPAQAEHDTLDVIDAKAASQQVAVIPTGNTNSKHELDATTAAVRKGHPPLAPMPEQRALGFIAFAACALIAVVAAFQQARRPSVPEAEFRVAAAPPSPKLQSSLASAPATHSAKETSKSTESAVQPIVESNRKSAAGSLGIVAFQSRSFVTSEQAITAVFILKRTQTVRGKAAVQWAARSGSADAGIDFSDVSGTARFADGQKQVAIYVPLRNDLLKEEDEAFKVCLRAPRQARISGRSCAEVTILDDDDFGPT